MSANVFIDIQIASDSSSLPSEEDFQLWAEAAVGTHRDEAEISLRIVDTEEGAELNQQWRQKQGPTNVLSFPSDLPAELELPLLGDLVVCAPVVEREAGEQKKSLQAHWAHMIVHGTLHLLGYDHIDDNEAEEMEALETNVVKSLGFPDPYAETV
ncbi:hydrolase [Endozoicomonas montiporae]|uniref:Endoribonuclease YbeY n=2 Tax=Endozoicomonas montiporae TaxID=1027273 RepID=A0A081N3K8_9GAMM|nr:rRNA maturation RNase YbeY [Endozoicomonas montiporae]AMO58339.1 putative metalloprotease [Endozoicomonas montiporae CL-33]KEQ13031.1 hydrolase [Endozoicomonas montiporae]